MHHAVVRAPWNEAFVTELENFPSAGAKDDQVDAFSGALNELIQRLATPSIRQL